MLSKDARVSASVSPLAGLTSSALSSSLVKPLLSIVVPAYQAECSIVRLLDSLCSWDGSDVEIIVVNDGSTDGTHALVSAYAAHDARICLIDKENEGRSAARNLGVSVARGDWVMFADSDDYLLDGWQAKVRAVFEFPCDLVIFGVEKSVRREISVSRPPLTKRDYIPAFLVRQALIDGDFPGLIPFAETFSWNSCWSRLYRRSCVSKASALVEGELFPEGLKFSEDRLFNLLYLEAVKDGMVLFDYAPIYYWDLELSSTVRRLLPDDATGLVAYKAALNNPSCNFTADDVCKLMSAEVASQFRRSARLPAKHLRSSSAIWERLLKGGVLEGCHSYLAGFMGKRAWMFKLSVALLFAGRPYAALCCQRTVQAIGARLHG